MIRVLAGNRPIGLQSDIPGAGPDPSVSNDRAERQVAGMLRRWTIRTRVLVGIVAPAIAFVALIASGVGRTIGSVLLAALVATLATALGVVIARSISRPLAVLATQAADVNALARVGKAGPGDELLPLDSEHGYGGEIGQLAGAIATGRQRALTMFADQGRQHKTLQEMAAHSAQRTNEVLGTALGQLDELARRDHEPATSTALAAVQRMVARGDRHTAGVLALLGRDAAAAVNDRSITDVVWAACLAVEAADRIELVSMAPVHVAATAVNDLAHLLAEVLENAAQASGGASPVAVLGEAVDTGYLVTVVDRGPGLDPRDLTEANRRTGRAVATDQLPGRALGLDIVGRLARRHGMLVRLGAAADGGIVVRIDVPAMMILESPPNEPTDVVDVLEVLGPEANAVTDSGEVAGPGEPEPILDLVAEAEAVEPAVGGGAELHGVNAASDSFDVSGADLEPVEPVEADVPIVVDFTTPSVPQPVGLSVPSIVIDPIPYVVRVQRPHDELLPTGQRKKRWAAALAKVGADN